MPSIPQDLSLDSTAALLREGYEFIPNRCRRFGSDIFATRLMMSRAVCISGEEAARQFYQPGRLTRRRALPPHTLRLLQDRGSAAVLDGEAHRRRKAMFMSMMNPGQIGRLVDLFTEQWQLRLRRWERASRVVLLHEARHVLCRAVCQWAGIALSGLDANRRTHEFGAMVEGAGAAGPRAVNGLLMRARTERWARGLLQQVRDGRAPAPEGSPLRILASHRDADGELMTLAEAAVELINLLRPTVAVDRYIMFAAHALHEHPEARQRLLATDDDRAAEAFVHEVRRFYPFFPMVAGRVLQPFEWRGHRFDPGQWVMLDLYGTLHDGRTWDAPDVFRPERFEQRAPGAYDLIPQGAGDHHADHRCAGEWITIALVKRAVRLLTRHMQYEVPPQDLRIDLARMPAVVQSRFVIGNVRSATATPPAAVPSPAA